MNSAFGDVVIMLMSSALLVSANNVLQAGHRATLDLLGRVDPSVQSPDELPLCLCCPESHSLLRSHFTSRPSLCKEA